MDMRETYSCIYLGKHVVVTVTLYEILFVIDKEKEEPGVAGVRSTVSFLAAYVAVKRHRTLYLLGCNNHSPLS